MMSEFWVMSHTKICPKFQPRHIPQTRDLNLPPCLLKVRIPSGIAKPSKPRLDRPVKTGNPFGVNPESYPKTETKSYSRPCASLSSRFPDILQPTYIHTCIHRYMHPCIHASMHPCIHTCIHVYMPACIHT